MKYPLNHHCGAPLLRAALAFAVSTAALRGADESAGAAPDETVTLDRLEITGEKLGRTAQETQTSVAAFSGADLVQTTDTSLADILQRTANVFAGNGTFSIRGISNEGFAGLDGSPLASVVLDGANLDNKMVFEGVLAAWDLDQIEILRGPQSTSQGRNSLAGSVVARTRNPSFTWDGQARATYASAGTYQTAAAFGGPLIPDWLAFRVSIDRQSTDGDLTNVTRHEDDWAGTTATTTRGKLLFQPAKWNGFSALATVARSKTDGNERAYAYGADDAELARGLSYENTPNEFSSTSDLGSLEINQEFTNGWLLTSTTAGTKLYADSAYDGDRTAAESLVYGFYYDNRSFSEELRLLAKGEKWKAVTGLYYADERLGYGSSGPFYYTVSSALPKVLLSADTSYRTDTETKAIFFNGDWTPSPRWTFTAGLRFDAESIDMNSRQDILVLQGFSAPYEAYNPLLAAQAAAATLATTGTDDFNVLLPQAGVTYHWTPVLSTGFTVSRGFRSGGVSFNQLRGAVVPYKPEYTWNYEFALRSEWLEKRVTANANLFYVDWRDQQVSVRHSDNVYDYNTENAGRSTLYGAELELREKIGGGWSVYQNAGYTHTRFDEFVVSGADYSGHQFPYSPRWTLGAGVAYEHARGWFGTLNATYLSNAYSGPDNYADLRLRSRRLVNAKLGYAQRHWSVYVFGTNLLDEDYFHVKWRENGVSRYAAVLGAARRVGVGTDIRF